MTNGSAWEARSEPANLATGGALAHRAHDNEFCRRLFGAAESHSGRRHAARYVDREASGVASRAYQQLSRAARRFRPAPRSPRRATLAITAEARKARRRLQAAAETSQAEPSRGLGVSPTRAGRPAVPLRREHGRVQTSARRPRQAGPCVAQERLCAPQERLRAACRAGRRGAG